MVKALIVKQLCSLPYSARKFNFHTITINIHACADCTSVVHVLCMYTVQCTLCMYSVQNTVRCTVQ